jgi:hypothetical protein
MASVHFSGMILHPANVRSYAVNIYETQIILPDKLSDPKNILVKNRLKKIFIR